MDPKPPAGIYPTGLPELTREWDGHVWTDKVERDPAAEALPKFHRQLFAFLRHKWFWIAIVGYLIGLLVAAFADKADVAWLKPFAAIGCLAVMLGFVMLVTHRVVGRDVIQPRTMIFWGTIGGVVGIAFGAGVELLFDKAFDLDPKSAIALLVPGPAEEIGKIAVPVILFMTGRYRDPRAGFLLVIATSAVFGMLEGIEYVAFADRAMGGGAKGHVDPQVREWATFIMAAMRPFIELLHPVLAGFVGAVAWQAAWKRGHFFTWAAIGALAAVAVLHSVNDSLSALVGSLQFAYFGAMTLIIYLFAMRRSARQLVPPDALSSTPPGWRPHIPKKLLPAD